MLLYSIPDSSVNCRTETTEPRFPTDLVRPHTSPLQAARLPHQARQRKIPQNTVYPRRLVSSELLNVKSVVAVSDHPQAVHASLCMTALRVLLSTANDRLKRSRIHK